MLDLLSLKNYKYETNLRFFQVFNKSFKLDNILFERLRLTIM